MTSEYTVSLINAAVTGIGAPHIPKGGDDNEGPTEPDATSRNGDQGSILLDNPQIPYDQAVALATQSIAQSTALAISDSADMLRNIETIMTTAIGVAAAKWLADPANVLYKEIITTANETIGNAAKNYLEIGKNANEVLELFNPSSSS